MHKLNEKKKYSLQLFYFLLLYKFFSALGDQKKVDKGFFSFSDLNVF
jgi:hypothetical protein